MTGDDSGPQDFHCMDCERPVYVNLKKGIKHDCGKSVPIEELEALADALEQKGRDKHKEKIQREKMDDYEGAALKTGQEVGYNKSAQELREVIEQYE